MVMAAAADWLEMGVSQVGKVEVEVVVVVVVMLIVVDVDVYMMFQQSHVIKHDPKKNPWFLYISLNKIFYLQRYNISTINNIYV